MIRLAFHGDCKRSIKSSSDQRKLQLNIWEVKSFCDWAISITIDKRQLNDHVTQQMTFEAMHEVVDPSQLDLPLQASGKGDRVGIAKIT